MFIAGIDAIVILACGSMVLYILLSIIFHTAVRKMIDNRWKVRGM
jgi:hypothetical protein